jgi:Sec7-like guanine-nucleotide exchange factor
VKIGVGLFNDEPKKGLEFIVKHGLFKKTPEDIARFFYTNPEISKSKLGEYFGEKKEFCIQVMRCYLDCIPMAGVDVDVALRTFLSGLLWRRRKRRLNDALLHCS